MASPLDSHPYKRFSPEKMILRDHLAFDRTVLANERTILAYQRTAITLFIMSLTLIKLFADDPSLVNVGYGLIPLGIIMAAFGIYRFFRMRRLLKLVYEKTEESDQTQHGVDTTTE